MVIILMLSVLGRPRGRLRLGADLTGWSLGWILAAAALGSMP